MNGKTPVGNKRKYDKNHLTWVDGKGWEGIVYKYTLTIPPASLIYLDPPYKGTSTYSTARYFDYGQFYDWARQMKRDGHTIFVSEYQMPGDFKPVWQKTITNSVNVSKTYKATETLWTI